MRKYVFLLIVLSVSGYAIQQKDGVSYKGIGISNVVTSSITAVNSKGLYLLDDGGNGIFIKDGGNVGIGLDNPSAPAHIYHPTLNNVLILQSGNTYGGLRLKDGTSSTGFDINAIGNSLHLYGGGDIRMVNLGNVGIGEVAPQEKLQISTSTTSGYSLGFAGAFQSLPASGHEEGTMAYQVSDHTLYISTIAVTNVNCWKAVW